MSDIGDRVKKIVVDCLGVNSDKVVEGAESEAKRPPIPIEGGHPVDGVKRGPLSAF
jgi:hypothetical protein